MIYEDINDRFGYANYLGLKVLIDKTNGYINGTKLCNDNNKRMCHWLSNK